MNNRSIAYIVLATASLQGLIQAESSTPSSSAAKSVRVVEQRVGYIDAYQVMRESEEGKIATRELEQRREALSSEIQKDYQAFAQAESEYKTKVAMMSESARSKEEERLVKMQRALENKAKESEEELKMAMQRTSDRVAKQVREAAAQLGKELKLSAVCDTMSGQVLYVADEVNYTAKAITAMDKEYKLAQSRDARKEVVAGKSKTAPAA